MCCQQHYTFCFSNRRRVNALLLCCCCACALQSRQREQHLSGILPTADTAASSSNFAAAGHSIVHDLAVALTCSVLAKLSAATLTNHQRPTQRRKEVRRQSIGSSNCNLQSAIIDQRSRSLSPTQGDSLTPTVPHSSQLTRRH